MKKIIYVLIILSAGIITARGQQPATFEEYYLPKHPKQSLSPSQQARFMKMHNKIKHAGTIGKTAVAPIGTYHNMLSQTDAVHWMWDYSQGSYNTQDDPFYTNPNTGYEVVFQDSLPLVSYINANYGVSPVKQGAVLDPTSAYFFSVAANPGYYSADANLNKFTPYTLDTIWVDGLYNRVGNSIDTLQLEVFWAPLSDPGTFGLIDGLYKYVWTDSTDSPRNDTMPLINFKSSPVNGNTCFLSTTNRTLIKYVLTDADTAGDDLIPIKIGQAIPAGNVIGVAYTFVPGYRYTASDVLYNYGGNLNATKSSFVTWAYYAPSTPGGYPDGIFYDQSAVPYTGKLSGGSFNIDNFQRYGAYTGADSFLNTLDPATPFEGYDLYFTLTANITGIDQVTANGGLNLNANYPNPCSRTTSISYTLSENVPVSLFVYDITGQKLLSVESGQQSSGVHSIELDVTKFSAGVYLYTLVAGENSLTKRMVVAKDN